MQTVFITGGTGYIGSRLIKALLYKGGYHIKALVRSGSESKLPKGCEIIVGNALNLATYVNRIQPARVFIHLVGVAHPSPAKRQQFKDIDLVSVQQASAAAKQASISHFIYLSVAQYPTKIMQKYQVVRASGEALLLNTAIPCSFIRPWYVLGPGHWWPLLLKPVYWICRNIPSLKETSEKLDTVTIGQMITVLKHAIDHPPNSGASTYEVKEIKSQKFMN
jgi:nucleoside-diphosphate-sugar epimerase